MPSPDSNEQGPASLGRLSIAGDRKTAIGRQFPRPFVPAPTSGARVGDESASPLFEETYDLGLLNKSRQKWRASAALRAAYGSIYHAMAANSVAGPALEIGSGSGTIKEFLSDVVTSDIRRTPYVDRVASAYALTEVEGGPWATIYALDVLHHLRAPFQFLASAAQALREGGRIVLCEPAATPWGRAFYRCCHHEPMCAQKLAEPYEFPPDGPDGDFANMGMAWSLFVRDRESVGPHLESLDLTVRQVQFRDVLAYPGSGGFSGPQILPSAAVKALLAAEKALPQAILRVLGLRMLIALERTRP